jgi:hypothetical protein
MNRIVAIALFVGATLMTAGSAAAESNALEVNVPFNFTVNNTYLPAGNYTIGLDRMFPDMLVIRDHKRSVKINDFGLRGTTDPGRPYMLIFHGYGGQYFLSEVHFESASNGILLPATKSERQARKSRPDGGLLTAGGASPEGSGIHSVQVSGKAAF